MGFKFSLHSSPFLERARVCVSLLLRRFLKRCSHERTTVFLERENRGERERERKRKREIVSELELYSLCWRFGFFSLVVQDA